MNRGTPHSLRLIGIKLLVLFVLLVLSLCNTFAAENPSLSIDNVAVLEGNTGTTSMVFTVTLFPPTNVSVTVEFNTLDGTAIAGSDYVATNGTLTFDPGTTNQTIAVEVTGDLLNEPDELFFVTLTNAANAVIGIEQGTATILNDDPAPGITITDVSVAEGDAGTTNAVFTVSLSAASGQTVTVDFATANGTATAGSDYFATNGTLAFAPGTTSQTVTVVVNGDVVNEADETFFVNLSNPTNGAITRTQGVGTIVNDDPVPGITINDVSVTEGNSGTTNAVFTVSLSAASEQTVTVNYATANGTATAGSDYVSTNGVFSFAPGTTSQSVTVKVNGDVVNEADETFFVNLSNPTNGVVTRSQGVGTIVNDDPAPGITINDVSVTEGNSGTTNAVFTVSLSAASEQTVTVSYTTANGTATAGSDYVSTNGVLSFAPGTTSQSITVQVNGDSINETNETFFVNLSNATNAVITRSQGVGTTVNDDPVPGITINDVSVTEGNSGTTNAVFTVSLSAASEQTVTVNYTTANGTAIAGSDYVSTNGVLSFTPGTTSQNVTVKVNGDVVNEADETFFVNLSNATNAVITRSQGVGTIVNDDAVPGITINDASVTEGNSGTTNAVFTVSLSAASEQTVTVTYTTANGTATAGSDYSATNGTLIFLPGTTTQLVAIAVNGDVVNEADETFFVNLGNPTNGVITRTQGVGTIVNDDPAPGVTIGDLTVIEGASGTTIAAISVSLDAISGRTVTVNFGTQDGSAVAPGDYLTTNGTISFVAGVTNQTINVPIVGDAVLEPTESFFVNLFNATNTTITRSQATVTILDEDGTPSIATAGLQLTAESCSPGNGVIDPGETVTLNLLLRNSGTANTTNLTATLMATGGVVFPSGSQSYGMLSVDHTPVGRTFTFRADGACGDAIHVTLQLHDGTADLGTVTFNFNLGVATSENVTFSNPSAIIIPDSGPAATYPSIINVSGLSGTINRISVTLSNLSHTFDHDVEVLLVGPTGQKTILMSDIGSGNPVTNATLTFADDAATSLPSNTDLDPITSGTYRPTDYIPFVSVGDRFPLPAPQDQPYPVSLAGFNGTAPNGTWSLYIFDDTRGDQGLVADGWTLTISTTNLVCCVDPASTDLGLTMADAPDPITVSNQLTYTINVTNSGPATATNVMVTNDLPAGVTFNSASSSQGTWIQGGSQVVFSAGNVPAGTSFVASITVTPLTIGTITNYASVSGSQLDPYSSNNSGVAVTTVGPRPNISISDVTLIEGNAGTTNAIFTVSLSGAALQPVMVSYATANGTATAGSDYVVTNGVLSFAPGTTNQSVTVKVNGDVVNEADETFFVNLSNATNGVITRAQGTGTIVNDDPVPGITINDVSVVEGNSGTTNAVFTVSLSAASEQTVTVNYTTANGTATAGSDYVGTNGVLSFAPGTTSQSVTVKVNGDAINEADETFFVNLSNATNGVITRSQGVGTIVNDDAVPGISINDVSVVEGNSGTTNAVFTVSLSAASEQTVTVDFATANGIATAGSDYFATNGTLAFAPGTTSQTVTVVVNGDVVNEADETFFVNLSNPTNGAITRTQGVGTIVNDDPVPGITINDVSVTEGNSGTTNAVFTVSLSAASEQTVTVNYATANGTATAGSDFAGTNGVLTFAPGTTNQTITIKVNGDVVNEADETFFVNLSNTTNGVITRSQGVGTIVNDDAVPGISINDVSVVEGNSGTTNAVFTVSLSAASEQTVTVSYITANGTATAGSDYVGTNGVLSFAPGTTNQSVTVKVNGDVVNEADETFFVNLSNATNAVITRAQGVGTIVNDDPVPGITINDVSVTEGNSGTTNAVFTVSLSAASEQTVTVNYTTANGTATVGSDYLSTNGVLSFAPGTTSQTVTVKVNGDVVNEADETFFVNLSNATNAVITRSQGVGTIVNDDAAPGISINDVSVTEGNSGTTNVVFTVSLSAASEQTVTVNYATANGTATAGSDFAGTNGVLTFAPGTTIQTITIKVNGDVVNEADETFFVNLSNPTNGVITRSQGVGTIVNDDPVPGITINDVSLVEGNSGTTNAVFTVSLSAASEQTVTVSYTTANGTATAGSDYLSTNGVLSFAPGATNQSVTVKVNGDVVNEADETFFVNLSNPTNGVITRSQGVGTIVNDDAVPGITINDVSVTEGNSGTTNAVFTVSLSAASEQTVTLSYTTANGTATAGSDYSATNGTLIFLPGTTTQLVAIAVNGDVVNEADETFFVNLGNPTNGVITRTQGVGTIVNDDPVPGITINDVSVTEGNSGTTNAVFTVTLSAGSEQTVTVSYTTANGTATAGSDYVGTNGVLSFTPGMTSQSITVQVNGDSINETNETFFVNLSNATNGVITRAQGAGTIVNDDPMPGITINDVSVIEGNSGTVAAVFTVSLDAISGQNVRVNYSTTAGTATSGPDYLPTDGTLTFTPGVTNLTVVVVVFGDTLNESNETFFINLAGAVNGTIVKSQGIGTILNDDPVVNVSINDVSVVEGNSGTTNAIFTVTLSAVSGQTVTVDFATANGTALSGGDYAASNGSLSFAPGTTSQSVTVKVNGDVVNEADETFFVNLSNPTNAVITRSQGVGTIVNDDPAPGISINDVSVTEGNSGTTNAVFTVSLSAASEQTVTVSYSTANGTATAGSDYLSTNGVLSFAPGTTSQTVTVKVNGDVVNEADETFFVNLSNATNAVITRSQGVGTIVNDDPVPGISINDVSVTEGNSGTTNAVFTVSLSAASEQTVTVNYSTANGTATVGSDYLSTNGVLSFAPGTTSQNVTVKVNGDVVNEADETFFVNLSNPTNGVVTRSQGVGTIVNDDPMPDVSISDASVVEGNNGVTNAVFAVTLSSPSAFTITVDYATDDGSANAGSDYIAAGGTLTFAPGITNQTLTVAINGDTMNELDETFFVNLFDSLNAGIARAQATGTILNDDPIPGVTISDASVIEDNSGTSMLVFTASLSAVSGQMVAVDYATADGTATAGSDYDAAAGTLIFSPGMTSQPIAIAVAGDLVNEADETILVNLSNPTNSIITRSQGVGTILNDDPVPAITISDVSVLEGDAGTTNALFSVSLSEASEQTITVHFATADGTALAGADYFSTNGIVTFAPGTVSQTITVKVKGDALNEVTETFFVNLTNPVNASIAVAQATGTILDDDPTPGVTINDVSVVEGNSGTTNATFTVTLDAPSGQTVTVDFVTADGTAMAGSDYVAATGTVTFPPGITSQTLTIVINGDTVNEADETILVNLINPVNCNLSRAQGICTIVNDDPVPGVSISDTSVSEGDSGTTNAAFLVSLSVASGQTVTIHYATANGTAIAGTDYLATNGSITFPPGTTSQSVSVMVNGDTVNEANETFFVNLSSPTNAVITRSQGVGTILNDDAVPALSISDIVLVEGNSGTTNAIFTVTLSVVSGQAVTVSYATADGTAVAGSDYIATNGVLTFAPGVTNQTAIVKVNGGTMNELDETFTLNLTNAVNATILNSFGTATILNDDPVPQVTINDTSVGEGPGGTTNAIFSVSLGAPSGQTITVGYATADGTAIAGSDYTPTNGVLTFPAGTTNGQVVVAIIGDNVIEPTETFLVNLSNPTNATIARSQAVGTIVADETRTTTFTNSSSITIPQFGAATPYPSTIDLSGLPGTISKVAVTLVGLTHTYPQDLDIVLVGPAGQKVMLMSDAGTNKSLSNVTLTFDDSASTSLPQFSQIVSGTFKPTDYPPGDSLPSPAPFGPYPTLLPIFAGANPNGTWKLFVYDDSSGDFGNISGGWRLTIVTTNLVCCSGGADSDVSVTLSDSPDPIVSGNNLTYSATVINSGPAAATGVTLTNLLPSSVTFVSATSSQGSCSQSGGIVTCNLGSLDIGAVATVNIVVVPTTGGSLTNSVGVTADQSDFTTSNNVAAVTTTVNLPPPSISITDTTVMEGNQGTTNLAFSVTLSRTNAQTVTVIYATANGSATSGSDYLATSGTITFSPGITNQTVNVTVYGDALIEGDETVFVNLSSPVNATISRSQGRGTILNDDGITGQLDHFAWDTMSATQYVGYPFPVTVRAVDPGGTLMTNFTGAVSLRGFSGSGPTLSVLITEIDTGDEDKIELANVTAFPVDLSGWQITVYDWISWPDPEFTFTIPSGTTNYPGEVFVLHENGTVPGAYPNFYSGANIFWLNESVSNQVAVLLRNASGQTIDFFCAVDGFPSGIVNPTTIPATQWQGNPVAANSDTNLTYQRTGNTDHNSSLDWAATTNNIGTANPNLTNPFAGPQPVTISPTISANFVGGIWTGDMTVSQMATNMYINASDGNGHKGASTLFNVNRPIDLAISKSSSLPLVQLGQVFTYTISVTNNEDVMASDLLVTDALPAGISFVSGTTTQGTLTRSGSLVSVNLGFLTNFTDITIALSVTATNPGLITNIATVSAAQLDENPTNNAASAVIAVNAPPTISVIGAQTIAEDSSTGPVAFTVGDLETPVENLVVTAQSSNTALVPNTNIVIGGSGSNLTINLTPLPNQFGTTTITITASDTDGGSATRSFALTVAPVNDPPTLDPLSDLVLNEDAGPQLISLSGISTGAANENDTITITAVSSNPAVVPNPTITYTSPNATGTLTLQSVSNAFGSALITLTANDGRPSNNIVVRTFNVTVNPVNDAPTLDTITNLLINQDSGPRTINLTGITSGASNENDTLTITASSTNPDLIQNLTLNYTSPNSTGTLSFYPATNSYGSGIVTVTVNDGQLSNNVVVRTFTITVNALPAISTIPSQTTPEDTSTTAVPILVGDVETAASNLVLTAISSNPALLPTNNIFFGGTGSNRTVTLLPATNQFGTSIITVTVKDTDGGSNSQSFSLTVNPVNDPPTLNALGNLLVNQNAGQQTVTLSGIATGATNETDTLTVTASSSNPGVVPNPIITYTSPNATGSLKFTPVSTSYGTATITVMVDDGQPSNNIVVRTFVITVNALPTVGSVPDQTTAEDTPISLPFVISDAETSADNLVVTGLSANTNIVAHTNIVFGGTGQIRTMTISPNTNQVGTIAIVVTVRDTDGGSSSRSFNLTVGAVNDTPTLDPISNRTLNENSGPQTVSLTGITSGATNESDTITVTAASSNPGLIPNPTITYTSPATTGSLVFTPVTNANGSAIISVTVNDNRGSNNIVVRQFVATVNPVNTAPAISAITNQSVLENKQLTIPFTILDVETAPLSLTLSGSSTNTALVASTNIVFDGSGTNRTVTIMPKTNQFGTTRITLTVTDGNGGTSTNSFVLTVVPVNQTPTLDPIRDAQILESANFTTLNLTGISSGATNENQTLTITAVVANPTLIPNMQVTYSSPSSTGSLRFKPANSGTGSSLVTVTLNDGGTSNNIITRTLTIYVTAAANTLPTISTLPNRTIVQDSSTGPISFTIGDAQTAATSLTVIGASSNPTLVPAANVVYGGSGSNRTVTVTPTAGQIGTATITTTVVDGSFGTATNSFVLTVNRVNHQPVISSIANQFTSEDTSTGPISFTVGDVENLAANLIVTATSGNTTLVPNASIAVGGSGTNRALSILPATNQTGTATITVTVTDGDGSSTNTSFVLTVNAVNDLPTISGIADQSILEDTTSAPVSFIIGDLETAASGLTVSGTSSNTGLLLNSGITFGGANSNRTVTLTPLTNQFGTSTVTVTVTDSNGGTASTSFLLKVLAVNDPPTLDPITNMVVNQNSASHNVNLTGITSGASNETDTLAIAATSSNPALIPNPTITYTSPNTTGVLTFTASSNSLGSATITVTVNDGQPTNNAVSRTFTVAINTPPTISAITNQVINEDTAMSPIPFTIGDAETPAANLIVSASSSNTNLVPATNITFGGTDSNRTVALLPATNEFGATTVTLTVTDGNGAIATNSFLVTVNPVNDPPGFAKGSDVTVSQDAGPQSMASWATAINAGPLNESNQTVAFVVSNDNAALFSAAPAISPVGTLTFTSATNVHGSATVTVRLQDNGGTNNGGIDLSAPQTFVITVVQVNHAPVLTPISDKTVNEGNTLTVPVTATDSDVPPDVLTFSLDPGAPLGSQIDAATGTFTYTPLPGQISFTNSVTVRVTDNGSPPLSDTKSFNIIVIAKPRLASITDLPDGSVLLSWQSYSDATYRLQYKNRLLETNWLDGSTNFVAGASTVSILDTPGTNVQRFYRLIQVSPP